MRDESCPSRDELAAYLAGAPVDERVREAMDRHLKECIRCSQAAEGTLDGDDTVIVALRKPPGDDRVSETSEQGGVPRTTETRDRSTILLPPGSAQRQPTGEASFPVRVGDHELIREIGRGGMGVVYLAKQLKLNRLVALKMIRNADLADASEVQRFRAEAEAAAQLDHPGIVPIYEVGESDGRHYFSMAFVDATSLADRLTRETTFAPQHAADLVRAVAEAVGYAHQRGVIHRDLKPSNILLDSSGQPKVSDFGLAKRIAADRSLTATGQVLGTPSYMPPEQAAGRTHEVRETADIYALGAVLYALLCGRPPFQADDPLGTLRQVLEQEPVPLRQFNARIPIDLETICLKCLAKDRHQRYASALELADELRRFLNGEPIQARPVGATARLWRWCRRQPLAAGLIAAVTVSLVLGASVSTYFAVLAQKRAYRAQEGTRIAVRTLETVIYNVQEKLRSIPAARETRRELLKQSMDELQKLAAEFPYQANVDRDTATVLLNLGMLFDELQADETPGATAAAETHFLKARDIFRELLKATPSDVGVQSDLAFTNEQLGELYLNAADASRACEPLHEAVDVRRDVCRQSPQDRGCQFQLSWALTGWAEACAESGQHREALAAYDEATGICERLTQAEPDSAKYRMRLADCYEKTGDVYLNLGDIPKTQDLYERSFHLYETLYQSDPNSSRNQLAFSTSCERMGDLRLRQSDPAAAHRLYQQMLQLSQQFAEADPTNLRTQWDLAVAYEKVGQVSLSLNDLAAAEAAYQRVYDLRRPLADNDPTNPKVQSYLQTAASMLNAVKQQRQQTPPTPD